MIPLYQQVADVYHQPTGFKYKEKMPNEELQRF